MRLHFQIICMVKGDCYWIPSGWYHGQSVRERAALGLEAPRRREVKVQKDLEAEAKAKAKAEAKVEARAEAKAEAKAEAEAEAQGRVQQEEQEAKVRVLRGKALRGRVLRGKARLRNVRVQKGNEAHPRRGREVPQRKLRMLLILRIRKWLLLPSVG